MCKGLGRACVRALGWACVKALGQACVKALRRVDQTLGKHRVKGGMVGTDCPGRGELGSGQTPRGW